MDEAYFERVSRSLNPQEIWVDRSILPLWTVVLPWWPSDATPHHHPRWRIEQEGQLTKLIQDNSLKLALPLHATNLKVIIQTMGRSPLVSDISSAGSWEQSSLNEAAEHAKSLFFGPHSQDALKHFFQHLSSTISIKSALESFLHINSFKDYQLGVLYIHQKGEPNVWQICVGRDGEHELPTVRLEAFNSLFSGIKKSKHQQFNSHTSKWNWLPFSGSFLAKNFSFTRFNAIWLVTREEFLAFSAEEINPFDAFGDLFGFWLEDLLEQEFSDLRLAETLAILDHAPTPLVIQDFKGSVLFSNNAFNQVAPDEIKWGDLGGNYQLGIGQESGARSQLDSFHRHKILLLGDLFNTLRHELSNPLFGLSLTTDLLLGQALAGDSEMVLTEVRKNIRRCQMIIENLSKLYSEDNSTLSSDLGMVAREALTLAKSELKGVVLQVNTPAEQTVMVEGKPLFVVQIIFNLLVNSAQALRQTSRPMISLTVSHDEHYAECVISDNGPGLPSQVKENLFKPFLTTKEKGHGLGLSLSRDLALKIGGELSYREKEAGASFSLKLRRSK